ncbi:MAG: ATP-binding cassette domain-containing protein [Pseudomonadota bacterium]
MAAPPILTLSDIALGFGGRPLFQGITLALGEGERLCVVGRNGSGKSTLLKIIAGQIEADAGERFVQPGKHVAYLPQQPDATAFATLGDFAAAGLGEADRWRAEAALDGLKVDASRDPANASGGEIRRAALAALIAEEADLMLLDEPTNHLDIEAIEWLEEYLGRTKSAFVLISHDRAFLTALSRGTLWLDRGEIRRSPKGFADFEDWRDKIWEEEDAQRHKLDRLIKAEAHWSVYGISARRTRNQGRLRRLAGLREERAGQIRRAGTAAMALEAAPASGKLVVEAKDLAKSFGARAIVRDFSIRVARGERIALVGPNGAGKTTLLKMLIGQTDPDAGSVRLGANIEMAVFDQNRAQLDPEKSLWDTLAGDKALGVAGRNDQILVRGRPKHVVAYLKDFLFDERQARGPVKALSGGEVSRLLLARIMARPSNVLVLDEPTNDLDVETLDLLQELIGDFEGTVLMVSHDRDFLDRVATTTIAMEGDGRATTYAGGWSDYRAQRGDDAPQTARDPSPRPSAAPRRAEARTSDAVEGPGAEKLSFKQRRRLEELPAEIDRLSMEIGKIEGLLADPDLFTREPKKFETATAALVERQTKLDAAEEEWLELEDLRERSDA